MGRTLLVRGKELAVADEVEDDWVGEYLLGSASKD